VRPRASARDPLDRSDSQRPLTDASAERVVTPTRATCRLLYSCGLVFRSALAILIGLGIGVAIGVAGPTSVLTGIASIVAGIVVVVLIVGAIETFGQPQQARTDDRLL
jgi:hypothetical protein